VCINLVDWHSYYSRPTALQDAICSWIYHWPYLLQTIQETKSGALEIGCGRGIHSILLSYLVHNVVGIDDDPRLLVVARKSNSRFHGRARFVECDAFNLSFPKRLFGVCFSQGLLEHFSDNEICLLAEEQLNVADTIVASVPSGYYVTKDRGDERLMLIEDWRKILRNYCTRMFYYGFRPKEPDRVISLRNLRDIAKIALTKSYQIHICMLVRKADV
jgi:SAM-dependent methyltransferase